MSGRPRPLEPAAVERIVAAVLAGEGQRDATVSVRFLGRDAMRRMHAEYKDRRTATDVLAFRLPGPGATVVGDIYVCPWVAGREAQERGIPVIEEVTRLLIHGTLHVLGYEHPDEGRTRSPMWKRQEQYVRQLT